MRILLAHAIDTRNHIESLFVPLGLGYLASAIAVAAPDAEVRVSQTGVETAIDEWVPDFLGISSVTQNFSLAMRYARRAKQHGIPVVVGGTHISTLPRSLPQEMDVGVIGEGEGALVELIAAFGPDGWRSEDLASIPGIVYHGPDGDVRLTARRPPIEPLDRLPLPARELLGVKRHAPQHLFSSRGCPYRCVFCASSRFWPRIRAFSPRYVVDEVQHLMLSYAPSLISFYDDLFIFDAERLAAIVELLEQQGIAGTVEFSISARANLVDERIVALLKRMNVTNVNMGLESGSARSLAYLKPAVTVEQNEAAVRLLDRAGIGVNASFVIGAPQETAEDVAETLRFIERMPLNIVNTYLLTPLPGTPIWDFAEERGLVSNDMDWGRLAIEADGGGNHIHLAETLSPDELLALHRRLSSASRAKRTGSLIRRALRDPRRILPYIVRKAASLQGAGGR